MIPQILASIDPSGALQFLKNVGRDVLKAESDACNMTAKDVQTFTVNSLLPSRFTLRSRGAQWFRPGTKFGFNIRFSKTETLEAAVGSQADWLLLQEKGGTKKANGHRLAIVEGARETPTSVLSTKVKPRKLLAEAGQLNARGNTIRKSGAGFILPFKDSSGEGVFVHDGDKLKLMYALKPSARIKPRLSYEEKGSELAKKNYPPNFSYALAKLIALKQS